MTNATAPMATSSSKKQHPPTLSSKASDAAANDGKKVLPGRYKTKMCDKFVSDGECPYDVRCRFAHGESDMRSAEQNKADGIVDEESLKAHISRLQHAATRLLRSSAAAGKRGGRHNNNHHAKANSSSTGKGKPAPLATKGSNHQHPQPSSSTRSSLQREKACGAAADVAVDATFNASHHAVSEEVSVNDSTHYPAEGGIYIHNPYALVLLRPEDTHYAIIPSTEDHYAQQHHLDGIVDDCPYYGYQQDNGYDVMHHGHAAHDDGMMNAGSEQQYYEYDYDYYPADYEHEAAYYAASNSNSNINMCAAAGYSADPDMGHVMIVEP